MVWSVMPQALSHHNWFPGLSTAIFVAIDGPPGPSMIATDGLALPQAASLHYSMLQYMQ